MQSDKNEEDSKSFFIHYQYQQDRLMWGWYTDTLYMPQDISYTPRAPSSCFSSQQETFQCTKKCFVYGKVGYWLNNLIQ